MHCRILGPLEVEVDGRPVALRGVLQRATLGALVLNANKVVPTSQLIRALWQDRPPATARKMLQNSIAGVRAAFQRAGVADDSAIITHSPGYLLRIAPQSIDSCRFYDLARMGRAHLATGRVERAAATLAGAIALWRGPVLADLRETRLTWPDVAALEDCMLGVLEDYAEAQLALNQHQEVIERLDAVLADAQLPPRERMLGQLMIALYRAGRQTDALNVYRRTRSELVEKFGLEPSRELRDLERAILAHDPSLVAPTIRVEPSYPVLQPRTGGTPDAAAPAGLEEPALAATAQRKLVTVMMLRVDVLPHSDLTDPEDLQAVWRVLAETTAQAVPDYGGRVLPQTVGSLCTAVFGVPVTRGEDAERAVLSALDLQPRLASAVGDGVAVQIALASGEALVTSCVGGQATPNTEVTGPILDDCLRLLTSVPPGGLLVCDTTRAIAADAFNYVRHHEQSGWMIAGAKSPEAEEPGPFLGRRRELELLLSLTETVRRHRRPQLATVLGEPGIGRSRLMAEYRTSLAATEHDVCAVLVRASSLAREPVREVLGDLLRLLSASIGCPPVAWERHGAADGDVSALCVRAREVVVDAARRHPLVIVFEDLHVADDPLLDFIEDLLWPDGILPLFVITTARVELLDRRPDWVGGRVGGTTVMLDGLPDQLVEQLLGGSAKAQLVSRVGGNPYFAREYLRSGAEFAVPWTVHRVIAARLDALPPPEKTVMQAVAVLGGEVLEAEVADVAGCTAQDAARHLRTLARRELLRLIPPHPGETRGNRYTFSNSSVGEVTYAQLPRADRHTRASAWLAQRSAASSDGGGGGQCFRNGSVPAAVPLPLTAPLRHP